MGGGGEVGDGKVDRGMNIRMIGVPLKVTSLTCHLRKLFGFSAVYKKHHPPSLSDEVWRLEKIGKDGAFHKRLSKAAVNTVKDFLTLLHVDPAQLRSVRILNSIPFYIDVYSLLLPYEAQMI